MPTTAFAISKRPAIDQDGLAGGLISDRARCNMGSIKPIKLLFCPVGDQVYDLWLIQPEVILVYANFAKNSQTRMIGGL